MGNVAANRSGKERLAAFLCLQPWIGSMKQREKRERTYLDKE